MNLLITGASGYIGRHVINHALKRGHTISAASRHDVIDSRVNWVEFDLFKHTSIPPLEGIEALIHLASNTTQNSDATGEAELLAAQKLLVSAKAASTKFIYISSQTARTDAPTSYGRTKWRIEQEVLSAGGWVIRLGQVYGGELRGLFGVLVSTVKHLPILPMFIPTPKVQPIHVDDLAAGLLRIAERGDVPSGIYCLASPAPISFSRFLDAIAESRLRCRRMFVPVPVVVINTLAAALGETLRVRLGLERLRSLFDLPVMESSSDLKLLGLVLRPLHSGMHPAGDDRRRHLLQEGRALLAYVLKETPDSAALRRYVRAIEHLRSGQALGVAHSILKYPILLSLVDEAVWADKSAGAEFSWRLDAATILAEATPLGARRFLALGCGHGMLSSALSMLHAVLCELFWRILRILFSPIVRIALANSRNTA